MNNQDKYVKEVVSGFQQNRGRASVYCFEPIEPAAVILGMITAYRVRSPEEKVFVIVDCYDTRVAIIEKLKFNSLNDNVTILSADYIKKEYKYDYKLIITVGINNSLDFLQFVGTQGKYVLAILTENIMNNEFITGVREFLPAIEVTVSPASVRADKIYLPVEEYRIGVDMNDEDKALYDKCAEYIATSISIFGEFYNIEKCKMGDPRTNTSAIDFRDQIARQNGWHPELDCTSTFNRQIDDIYNPNVLLERATTFYNILRERRELATDNAAKLQVILDLCIEHKDKKIIIVSKRGEFASAITEYINKNSLLKCGDFHNTIESTIATDEYGQTILVKSGANKGQPKVIGAVAISTANAKRFNDGNINILSIKNSSDSKLKTAVDLIIFSTPTVDGIIDFKTRFSGVSFTSEPTINYKVYCRGTLEAKVLAEQKESALIKVIDDSEDFIGYTETNDDNIW